MSKLNFGDAAARRVSARIAAASATLSVLKEIPSEGRSNGQVGFVIADGSRWIFSDSSAATGDDMLVVAPNVGIGRWLRLPGTVDLALAIAAATADAATLYTVPAGARLLVRRGYWEVTTGFTGGTSSAIGISSGKAAYNTKGDLLGGAAGDVAATLVAGVTPGTIGAKTMTPGILLVAGDTVRFDRITSAFGAGSGFAHLVCDLLANSGA